MINKEINPEVLKMAKINLEGNIIPQQWYRHITYPSGKPNPIAVTLLAEIVYWYRPVIERDPITGEVIGYRKKFKGDKLQRSYQSFADQFGFTKRQVQDAMKRLVELGLIRIEFRNIKTETGLILTNVMYVEPVTEKIEEITYNGINKVYEEKTGEEIQESKKYEEITAHNADVNSYVTSHNEAEEMARSNITPPTFERRTSHDKTEEVSRLNVTPPSSQRGTYTENTTQTTTENTTEKQKNSLPRITVGATLYRESTSPIESIYLCSKKVNNKLAKLIKINKLTLYYCLVNRIAIKPGKYKILRYRDDNVYSKIKNNKNLSLETYTNSKDLRSISKLHPNRDIVTCSSNKNISPGRDNISHVRELTNRRDPEPGRGSYRESNIYALTRINAGINNLNLGTSEKVSECSSLQKTRNDITTAQQAEEEPDRWEKVKSDEEIRYSYGDWDDYSIEEFDDGIIHTSPRAPHEIFVDPAAACSDNKAGSSEKTVSAQSKINCPAVRAQQVLEAAEEQSSKAQERNLMLNQQRKNLQEVLNAGTAEEVSTGFEITKLKIPGETIKLSNKVFLPNPDENILAPEVSAERVFCGDDSKDERTASSRNKNTEPAARTGFEVINWQVSKSVKAGIGTAAAKHKSEVQQLICLLSRQQNLLMYEAAVDKHVFPRDGPL